jgi:hypothetical protein
MYEAMRPIPFDAEGLKIGLFEVLVDGKPSGFVVKAPNGAEYPAADLADALGIIEEIKKEEFQKEELKKEDPNRSLPGARR